MDPGARLSLGTETGASGEWHSHNGNKGGNSDQFANIIIIIITNIGGSSGDYNIVAVIANIITIINIFTCSFL